MVLPLRYPSGAVEGYLEIGRDVTKELMYENRMQQSQRLQAIGTLAGGIAHDFNNILSGILGYAELALMTGQRDAEMEKFLREIIKAARRAGDLVGQILTFSRQTELELRPILPGPVLKEASKLLRASTPASIDIRLKIDSRSAILGEPTQIHQIVMNLFTNAVHAIGQERGTITIELRDFVADEEFTRTHPDMRPGRHIVLSVSDTGNGMGPEIMDHIFEPFFTTRSQGQGTGLGLSVVHGIVKKLEGIIAVHSQVGKGTAFNIYIPCTEMDAPGLSREASPIKKGAGRIILVDDEESILITTSAILTRLGYEVATFTDGFEALETIRENPRAFNVLITDHSMPKITGIELAQSLKEAGIDIPVILISGYLAHTMGDEVRDVGISEVMTKPISAHQLTETIGRVLGDPRPVDGETADSGKYI
jgi:nitrogen-specific signal transduction histidine kinase/CheY-like chemotaxis protein